MPPIGLLLNDFLLVCSLECHRAFHASVPRRHLLSRIRLFYRDPDLCV